MSKWKADQWLILITVAFALFTCGFFVGRRTTGAGAQPPVVSTQFPIKESVVVAPPAQILTQAPAEAEVEIVFPLDINTASQRELMELPGIGESLAGRILEYRQSFGGFESVEELTQVEGIGEGKLDDMREFVIVR